MNLNVKGWGKILRLFEKNIGEKLWDLGLSRVLIQKAWSVKEKTDKLDFIKTGGELNSDG